MKQDNTLSTLAAQFKVVKGNTLSKQDCANREVQMESVALFSSLEIYGGDFQITVFTVPNYVCVKIIAVLLLEPRHD